MTDRSNALTAMQSLFSGLESRIVRQRMLPHPGEGSLYDFDPNRVSRRSYRHGDLSPTGTGTYSRRESIGLLHKPMLGLATVKVCVVLDFAFSKRRFTPDAIQETVRWSLAALRPDIYFIMGIAGVREEGGMGHSDEVMRAISGGSNWRAALIEYADPGWSVTPPNDGAILPALFDNLFDPEPVDQKVARVDAALAAALELKEPGGFLLINDLASRVAVGKDLVTDRAMLYAERTPGIDVKDVGGDLIIQRDRFESVRA
ncbi:MAG: hypothetical protein KDB32_06795 [Planctomycetes bacterium]|nr:hypothetical protein [Planctomycetota bacterium]